MSIGNECTSSLEDKIIDIYNMVIFDLFDITGNS